MCYGGAEEGTASKAWVYSEQVYEPTIRPKYCPTLSCEKEPAFSNFQDYSMGIMVPKVSASSKTDDALKTINAVNGSAENENQSARYRRNAVRGSANTNENLPNSFLRSGLKIMYGERVGIQVLQHNTNQIKTREKPSPKTSDTAEAGALECYIRATSMLELMSAAGLNYRKPKFNSRAWRGPRQDSRTDRQPHVTTKASYDGAQIHQKEKHAALLGSTILTNDKIQRYRSSSKEQPTTPPEQATLGATQIKCISRQQFILSTFRDGPLNVDDEGERVCTTPLADIESNKMAQGYYRNFLMGEEKASGEILRFFPNFDKTDTVVVEAKTACGERHELTRKASPTKEVKTNVGPVQSTGTTTLLHNLSVDRDKEINGAQEYITGTVPASPTWTPRRPRTRSQAMVESAVHPEIEYPSDWDEDQEQPQGRPARGRKSTTRA